MDQPVTISGWSEGVFEAQVLTCLRATGARVGLLINFNSRMLTHGVRRFVP